jgi:hypothetical protein
MFSRRFDRRVYAVGGVLFLSLGMGVGFGAFALWPSRLEAGYSPEQPVPFSHQVHAGTLEMDCLYCHSGAAKGAHATVPDVSLCMNCHNEVQTKDDSGELKPAIAALLSHWEEKRPIEWIKVNDVADFVYFDHSRHVNSDIECEECHGPVETMTQMRREKGLKMAFCIDCHMEDPPEGPPETIPDHPGLGTRAPINCTTCHR